MAAADTKTWGVPQSRSQSSFLSTGSSGSSTGVDGQRRGSDQGNHSAISFCNTALSSEPDVNPLDEKEDDATDEADVENLQLASASALFNGKLEPYQQPLEQQQPQQYDTRHATPNTPHEQNMSSPPVNAAYKNSFERFQETIIHFPDSLPALSLMTFESSPVEAAASSENNDQSHEEQATKGVKRRSLKKRLSLKSLGLGLPLPHSRRQHNNNNLLLPVDRRDQGTCRQWSRDSNLTLINGQGSTLVIREDLQEPTDNFVKARLDATPIHSNPTALTSGAYTPSSSSRARSPIVCDMDMPKSYYSTPHKTFGGMGAGGGDDPQRFQSPSPTATTGTISPASKRYIDTRKRSKADKAALKKAVTMFSNERTFNHWIKFGMLLGALAMTLLNFSITDDDDHRGVNQELVDRAGRIGQSVGVCLMVTCLLCLLYAAATYHWRHIGLAQDKSDGRYLDRIGPTLLTIGLFVTLFL